jgi:16S rRNA (guanine527-N7)-methyltransferase
MNLAAELARGITALAMPQPDEEAARKLIDYLRLLEKWNRVYNLTAVRDPEKMLTHHLLDSLAVVPYIDGKTIADVGSGAGLPGIPLAIMIPNARFTLIESNHKRCGFVRQAIIELELTNADVQQARIETFRPTVLFDNVISRAFADLGEFVSLAHHVCSPRGSLIAMKGLHPYEEINNMPAGFVVDRVVPLAVPGVDGARHLVFIRTAES